MSENLNIDQFIAKCKSWDDFSGKMASLTKKQKGDCFERLTELYLRTKPEYQTTIKNVWNVSGGSSRLPKRVQAKLSKLPATTDEGIDLVAESRSGEFWSIQCKYKTDSDKALTVKELSTFTNLTFNTCAGQFAKAFVVHTSSKPVRKRKLLGDTSEIGLQRWLEMSSECWKLIHSLLKNKPARPKAYNPRPHQKKAIKAAKTHFFTNKESRGKLIMPCGTGKSLTAYWIAQALEAKTILVVVPSLALIKQGVEGWTREIVAQNESPLPEWLCVCSDDSTGALSKDEFVSETYDLGLPVTTKPDEIQEFLKQQTSERRIVFVTYQSSPVFAKAALESGIKFDLAIMDEAHKTTGAKSKSFATLLFDDNLPIKKRMYMTATERVMRGSHDKVVSMDKKEVYGDSFYQLSFKEAIHSEPPIISNYKILTLFITEDQIKSVIKDKTYVTDKDQGIHEQDSQLLATGIALRKAYKKFGIKHAVSFHRSIKLASDFTEQQAKLNDLMSLRPKVESFHISSKKSAGERTQLLNDFTDSPRALITNAKCLTEGVDVPAIDCVLFADPKQSVVDIVQAAGRALRPFEGKDFGYIMLPIVIPNGMDVDEFAKTTEFQTVSRVITALSTQDERIAEEFRITESVIKKSEKIIQFGGAIPVGMNLNFQEFAKAISAKVWERASKVNWRAFTEARTFARSLKVQSNSEWRKFTKSDERPNDIPTKPSVVYKDKGWISWPNWLGTGDISGKRKFLSFEEAREYVWTLKLKSSDEWRKFTKSDERPNDIPAKPSVVYKDKGWSGYGDWLGTGNIAPRDRVYRLFEEAREYVWTLKLKSQSDWYEFAKSDERPNDIPAGPAGAYKTDGWAGWGNWLGTGYIAPRDREYLTFKEAREYAWTLKLKSMAEWVSRSKSGDLPTDIPANPSRYYKDKGWSGYGDWLGTGNIAPQDRKFLLFEEARKFARRKKLKSPSKWKEFTKSDERPNNIHSNPNEFYKDKGWISWPNWLGTGDISGKRKFLSFEEAREYVWTLKLKSETEWRKFSKSGERPNDIPSNPARRYKTDGWAGWRDWLGY